VAVFDAGPVVTEAELAPELVRVAMLIVVFLGKAVPVPAEVPGAIGTVVEAVPLAETVLLMYELALPLALARAEEDDAEATADGFAPCTTNGPK
jgi:hypothetical protein